MANTNLIHDGSDITLRDAEHAHLFFNSTNFDTAPKAKFLYHVVFELTTDAKSTLSVQDHNLKILSVLAKTASLPGYTSTIETINQYNRKKKYQTKIDYKDVNISFYDDNIGISRSLLESYYKYYFQEANATSHTSIGYRDKFSLNLNRYGLDNEKTNPYFEYIKIFQLSKQKWFCYTLVNPIISQWSHDELSYSEGNGIMENKITVGYEAVLYSNGTIDLTSTASDPAGFGSTWYDHTDSPMIIPDPTTQISINPTIQQSQSLTSAITPNPDTAIPIQNTPTLPGSSLANIVIPKVDTQSNTTATISSPTTNQVYDAIDMQMIMINKPDLATIFVYRALASGNYSPDWSSSNAQDIISLPYDEYIDLKVDVIMAISTNPKIYQIAAELVE